MLVSFLNIFARLWKSCTFWQSLNRQTQVAEGVQDWEPERLQTGESFQITPTWWREGNYISLHQHAPSLLLWQTPRLLSNQTSDLFSRTRRQSPGISPDSTAGRGVDKPVWSGSSGPTPALCHDLPCLHGGWITPARGKHTGNGWEILWNLISKNKLGNWPQLCQCWILGGGNQ